MSGNEDYTPPEACCTLQDPGKRQKDIVFGPHLKDRDVPGCLQVTTIIEYDFPVRTSDEYTEKQSKGYAWRTLSVPCELIGSNDVSTNP